tara:strand:- start:85030 stop:85455 length:426 start_codon:yes stop_codon:yes gene_type:complete
LNQNIVLDTSEPHSVMSRSLLEGALAAPHQTFAYDQSSDLVTLACTLMISIARAHAFLQGNKRTGFVAGVIFLSINGASIRRPAAFDERAAELIIAALADESRCEALIDWVRKFARQISPAKARAASLLGRGDPKPDISDD